MDTTTTRRLVSRRWRSRAARRKVAGQDVLGAGAHALGNHAVEVLLVQATGREERAEVDGLVERLAVVHGAIEVDGHAGNEQQVAVGGEEAALDARSCAHQDAAGERQRLVEPGVVNHAAVALDVKTQVLLGSLEHGHGFHLVGGGVRVGRRHLEVVGVTVEGVLAHAKGDDAGAVAGGVVRAARLNVPSVALGQVGESGLVKAGADGCRRVEHAGAAMDEVDEALRGLEVLGRRPLRGWVLLVWHVRPLCWLARLERSTRAGHTPWMRFHGNGDRNPRCGAVLAPQGAFPQQVRTKPSLWRQPGAIGPVLTASAYEAPAVAPFWRHRAHSRSKCVRNPRCGVN